MPQPTNSLQTVAAALRITDGSDPAEPIKSVLEQYLAVAQATVDRIAPDAPEAIMLQAAILVVGRLYDQPTAGEGTDFAAAMRQSGAYRLLAPWIDRSLAGSTSDAGTAAQTPGQTYEAVYDWAEEGNDDLIPANKLANATGIADPAAIATTVRGLVSDWAEAGNQSDIPFARMDGTLEPWTEIADESIIPDGRLPAARLLPSPTGLDDGKVVKISSGQWLAGDDVAGSGGNSSALADTTRFRFVPGTGQNVGKVFLGFEYVDRYNTALAFPTRTSLDVGSFAYIPSDMSRDDYTISQSEALDVKGLLAQSEVDAIMNLVTSLPPAGTANWGQFYGLSDSSGQVKDVYYRREESTSKQTWLPARLQSPNGSVVGFTLLDSNLSTGYRAGGALSPSDNFDELVEEFFSAGVVATRVIVEDGTPLTSDIAIIMRYRAEGTTGTRETLTLLHDASFSLSGHRRYVSANYTERKFDPADHRDGWDIVWRNSGNTNDLILHSAQFMRKLADEDDLDVAAAKLQNEVYRLENRVEELENAPAPSGSIPEWTQLATKSNLYGSTGARDIANDSYRYVAQESDEDNNQMTHSSERLVRS